uniref:Uncharacterized protein n=1 Tax=Brassica campestris TaxID=3711 RepID=M4E395_BRACM
MGLKDTRPGSQTGYVGGVKFSNNSPTSPPKFGVTQVVRQVVGVDSDVGDVFETGGLCVSSLPNVRHGPVLRYRPSWEVVTDAALMPPPVPLTLLVLRGLLSISVATEVGLKRLVVLRTRKIYYSAQRSSMDSPANTMDSSDKGCRLILETNSRKRSAPSSRIGISLSSKGLGGRWAELSTFCVGRASMLFPSSF